MRRAGSAVLSALVLVGLLPTTAREASAGRRPLFEPTDLELEDPGVAELDLQFGAVRADPGSRYTAPDVELDLGLTDQVEFDLDTAFMLPAASVARGTFDGLTLDNLWLSAKLGLVDTAENDADKDSWALGLQLGPKVPVLSGLHGVGYEALVLIGRMWRGSHTVLNLGGLVDPGATVARGRPMGLEAGLDEQVDLFGETFAVLGELGGTYFVSNDTNQLHATLGLQWSPTPYLDLSIVGLAGFLPGGDRAGVLLGISPKLGVWSGAGIGSGSGTGNSMGSARAEK